MREKAQSTLSSSIKPKGEESSNTVLITRIIPQCERTCLCNIMPCVWGMALISKQAPANLAKHLDR